MNRKNGMAVLETCVAVIVILFLGIGGIEIFRIFRAQKSVDVAIGQAAEEYARVRPEYNNSNRRKEIANDAWNRALNTFSPNLPNDCTGEGACAQVIFNEVTIDQKRLVNVNGIMRIRSLFWRSSFWNVNREIQVVLEDGQRVGNSEVEYENKF